jgi:hypothetical protein
VENILDTPQRFSSLETSLQISAEIGNLFIQLINLIYKNEPIIIKSETLKVLSAIATNYFCIFRYDFVLFVCLFIFSHPCQSQNLSSLFSFSFSFSFFLSLNPPNWYMCILYVRMIKSAFAPYFSGNIISDQKYRNLIPFGCYQSFRRFLESCYQKCIQFLCFIVLSFVFKVINTPLLFFHCGIVWGM